MPFTRLKTMRVGADAERQREDDDEGRARLPRHHTRGEAGVLKELTQEGPDSRHGRSPSIDVAARIRERRH